MTPKSNKGQNSILSGLPADVLDRLAPDLEELDLPLGSNVYNSFETVKYVVFPITAMASIVATTESGQTSEVGVVGHEGIVGIEAVMGARMSPHKCMMQIAGSVFRIAAKPIAAEFERAGVLHDRILHFSQRFLVQVAQTTLCNRLHTIDERLPRWLLMSHDRVVGDVLPLTQEFISLMLGTSRVSVTHAARRVQETGCIKYVRGRITILDRNKLEDLACDCYRLVKSEYDRKYS